MCPNETLYQIAFHPAGNFPDFTVTYSNQTENVPEHDVKRNWLRRAPLRSGLDPPLRALQSARASSAAFALSAELRLAPHWQ
jgi:hypothetical protein